MIGSVLTQELKLNVTSNIDKVTAKLQKSIEGINGREILGDSFANTDALVNNLRKEVVRLDQEFKTIGLTNKETKEILQSFNKSLRLLTASTLGTVATANTLRTTYMELDRVKQQLNVTTKVSATTEASANKQIVDGVIKTTKLIKENANIKKKAIAAGVSTKEIDNLQKTTTHLYSLRKAYKDLGNNVLKTRGDLGKFNTSMIKVNARFVISKHGVSQATKAIKESSVSIKENISLSKKSMNVMRNVDAILSNNTTTAINYARVMGNFERSIASFSTKATDSSIRTATTLLEKYKREQVRFENAIAKSNKRLKDTAIKLKAAGTDTKKAAIAQDKYNKEIAISNRLLAKQRVALARANTQIAHQRSELTKISSVKWLANIAKRTMAYTSFYQVLQTVRNSLTETVRLYVEMDTASRTIAAVTDGHLTYNAALKEGIAIEKQLLSLTLQYGNTLRNVNKAALDLVRAGVNTSSIVKATEVVAKLGKLTGDTIQASSDVMVTYLHVFGKGADATDEYALSVEDLGGKLAYMANMSKLSTEDIGTFSNYALASAKAAGVTIDVVDALGVALTNAGNTASTAGTSVRKFFMALTSGRPSVVAFFKEIGISQAQLSHDIAQGGEESNQAMIRFLQTLKSFSKEEISKAVSGLGVRLQQSIKQFYLTADEATKHIRGSVKVTSAELNKAQIVFDGIATSWDRARNIILSSGNAIADVFVGNITNGLNALIGTAENAKEKSEELRDTLAGIEVFLTGGGIALGISAGIAGISAATTALGISLAGLAVAAAPIVLAGGILAYLGFSISNKISMDKSTKDLQDKAIALTKIKKIYQEYTRGTKDNASLVETKTKIEEIIATYAKLQGITAEKSKLDLSVPLKATSAQLAVIKDKIAPLQHSLLAYQKYYDDLLANKDKFDKTKAYGSRLKRTLQHITDIKNEIKPLQDTLQGINSVGAETTVIIKKMTDARVEPKGIKGLLHILSSTSFNDMGTELSAFISIIKAAPTTITSFSTIAILDFKKIKDSLSDIGTMATMALAKGKTRTDKSFLSSLVSDIKLAKSNQSIGYLSKLLATYKTILVENKKLSPAARTIAQDFVTNIGGYIKILGIKQRITKGTHNREQSELQSSIKAHIDYYNTLGNITKEWEEKEKLLRLNNKHLSKTELTKEIAILKKEFFDKKYKLLKEATKKEKEEIEKARQEYIKLNGSRMDGVHAYIQKLEKDMPTAYATGIEEMKATFEVFDSAWSDFFDFQSKNFLDFGVLGKSIIADLLKEIIKIEIVKPLAVASTAGIGMLGSFVSELFADGGVVESKGYATGGLLTGGSGVKDDLYLGKASGQAVFAMGGEYILNKATTSSVGVNTLNSINNNGRLPSGDVVINIENKSGVSIDMKKLSEVTNDDGTKTINIVMNAIERNPDFRSAIKGIR